MNIIKIILLVLIISFLSVNIVLNIIILSKLQGITVVYETIDSFEQAVEKSNEGMDLLVNQIGEAAEKGELVVSAQEEFINLTRNEWNTIIKLINMQAKENNTNKPIINPFPPY